MAEPTTFPAPALLKLFKGTARVTVLERYCSLNWRVRIEEDCDVKGRPLSAGALYIAGRGQLNIRGRVNG